MFYSISNSNKVFFRLKKNYFCKLEEYSNNFDKIFSCLFYENSLNYLDQKSNEEALLLKAVYANKAAFGDIVDAFRGNAYKILEDMEAASDLKFKNSSKEFFGNYSASNENWKRLNFKQSRNSNNNSHQHSFGNDVNAVALGNSNVDKSEKDIEGINEIINSLFIFIYLLTIFSYLLTKYIRKVFQLIK